MIIFVHLPILYRPLLFTVYCFELIKNQNHTLAGIASSHVTPTFSTLCSDQLLPGQGFKGGGLPARPHPDQQPRRKGWEGTYLTFCGAEVARLNWLAQFRLKHALFGILSVLLLVIGEECAVWVCIARRAYSNSICPSYGQSTAICPLTTELQNHMALPGFGGLSRPVAEAGIA